MIWAKAIRRNLCSNYSMHLFRLSFFPTILEQIFTSYYTLTSPQRKFYCLKIRTCFFLFLFFFSQNTWSFVSRKLSGCWHFKVPVFLDCFFFSSSSWRGYRKQKNEKYVASIPAVFLIEDKCCCYSGETGPHLTRYCTNGDYRVKGQVLHQYFSLSCKVETCINIVLQDKTGIRQNQS